MGRGLKIIARKKLSTEFNVLRRKLTHVRRDILWAVAKDWVKFLEESTWLHPRPVPRHMITIQHRGRGYFRVVLGWVDFPGSAQAAEQRFKLRREMFQLKIPKHVATGLKTLRGL